MFGSPQENSEGETSLGAFREVSTAGGGRPVCLGKVIPCGGTSGVDIWVRNLGAVGYYGKET